MNLDPYKLREFLQETTWEMVEKSEEFQLALQIHKAIKAAHEYVNERPRWRVWYDQIYRSSQSVVLNFCEGVGKGKGYYINAILVARGELYETVGGLYLGPPEICEPLKAPAKKLIACLNTTILNTPLDKSESYLLDRKQ